MDYVLMVMLTMNAWSKGWVIMVTTPDTGRAVASQPFPGRASCERVLGSNWFAAAIEGDPWLGSCEPVAVMWRFERPHR